MFSYAARTILSKTLRRILQKYLVDVNIDGVALGGEDGWGLVIKNVQFREGAVLFSFPVPNPTAESEMGRTDGESTSNKIVLKEDAREWDLKEGKQPIRAQVKEKKYSQEENIEEGTAATASQTSSYWFYRRLSSSNLKQDDVSIESSSNGNTQSRLRIATEPYEEKNQNAKKKGKNTKYTSEKKTPNHMMEFRIGKGGMIGNLGVKLVGSDLHIFVEDAFLVLEVVTKPTAQENPLANSKDESGENAETAPDDTKAKPDTENKLARMIASLPHVSLKKIIVKLVFVDETKVENNGNTEGSVDSRILTKDHVIEIRVGSFSIMDESIDVGEEMVKERKITKFFKPKKIERTTSNDPKNFRQKRITLGSQEEEGLCIHIFPPSHHPMRQAPTPKEPSWARCIWENLPRPFFELSGFDSLARIFVDLTKVEEPNVETITTNADEYDILTLDTFGGYYIPAIVEKVEVKDEDEEEEEEKNPLNMELGQSNFYRIAMGMKRRPTPYASPHSDDSSCWVYDESSNNVPTIEAKHMNECIPAPGVVIFFSVYHPIEINVERQSIEAIKKVMDILSSYKKNTATVKKHSTGSETRDIDEKEDREGSKKKKKKKEKSESGDGQFPSYMRAKNVFVLGCQINSIVIRFQLMKEAQMNENGHGFSFCELLLHSISVDCHYLNAPSLLLKDFDFDLGHCAFDMYKGVTRTQHAVLGKSDMNIEKPSTVPLRSTAYTLLKAASILSTSEYLDQKQGALQFRLIFSKAGADNSEPVQGLDEQKTLELRIGLLSAEMYKSLFQDLKSLSTIISQTLFPTRINGTAPPTPSTPLQLPKRFTWKYYCSLDGGSLTYEGIKCDFPSSNLVGEKSPLIGFSMQSILNQIQLKFTSDFTGCVHGEQFFKLMCDLPDNARMRTFLFLDDLDPLATALGMPFIPQNHFLSCYTINKHFKVKLRQYFAEREKRKMVTNQKEKRKQELLARMMRLDNDTLEDMLTSIEKKNLK